VFIDTGQERVLIETGIGDKWTPKQAERYGIRRHRTLPDSLRLLAGVGPEQISVVVNTHLHFDHAGGNTKAEDRQQPGPTFPNARYFVSKLEFEHAENPTERDRASYLPENWQPLAESGQLELQEQIYEVVPGLKMETFPGHNRSMQCWKLDRGGETIFGFADLVPMRAHVQFPWIMGYDLYPVETLEAKKRLLPQAAREGWLGLFYHDPDEPLCRLIEEEGALRAVPFADKKNIAAC
jgi:glyoxylase-like metal-dependent hydrolase (beta-lactamase superfamily II)